MQAIERHVDSLDWITLILLTAILLLVIVKSVYPQRYEEFTSLLTSNKFMVFKGKENNAFHPFNILMFLVNALSVSLFLFILFRFFSTPDSLSPGILFIRIFTAYTCFVLLKFSIEKIFANIFDLDDTIDYYLFQKLSHRNFISLILLIFSVILVYAVTPTNGILYVGMGFVLLANLLSLIVIYRQNQNLILGNWFYFILYLCALEIAPYIILYKLITT